MPNSFTLESAEPADVEALIKWVTRHPGVEAFPVYDYVALEVPDRRGADAVPGALNGVTVQWDVEDQLILETPADEENIVHPVAASAVHVRVGDTISVSTNGFEVDRAEEASE